MSAPPDLAAIAALFDKPRRSGAGWDVCCPIHGDSDPSLSIGLKGDRLVVKCHAGCDQRTVFAEVLSRARAAGLMNGRDETRGQVVATYTYRDEGGRPLFRVLRWEPKGFSQQRWDGGTWCRGCKGARFVPYNLDKITATTSGTIYVVEGEKDCDRLASLGLVATTNNGGAGKWRAAYSEMLRGRDVVIIPDTDPAGLDHARQVGASLETNADVTPGVIILDGAKDVSDWLDQGHALDELPDPVPWTEWAGVTMAAPGAVGQSSGETALEAMRAWLVERYQPRFRRGGAIWSATEDMLVRPRDLLPDLDAIEALRAARDAPAKPNALPRFFNTWSRVAFGELVKTLPLEEDCSHHEATGHFVRQVAWILTSMITTARASKDMAKMGGHPERRSIVSWCAKITMTQAGWQRIRSYECWAQREQGGLSIAIRPALARQVQAAPEVADMSIERLGRLAEKYGVGSPGEVDGDAVVILHPAFVAGNAVDLSCTDGGAP